MMNLIYLVDLILFLIFKIILNISSKKHETIPDTDNPLVQIDVNEIKNRNVFKIKTCYKLDLLTEETMQLLSKNMKLLQTQTILRYKLM